MRFLPSQRLFTVDRPMIDNGMILPRGIDRGIALLSRAMGPVLLVAALVGAMQGLGLL